MIHLIQDLLDYAQIKAGKFRKNMSKINIKETVVEVISLQKQQAESKGIQLIWKLSGFNN